MLLSNHLQTIPHTRSVQGTACRSSVTTNIHSDIRAFLATQVGGSRLSRAHPGRPWRYIGLEAAGARRDETRRHRATEKARRAFSRVRVSRAGDRGPPSRCTGTLVRACWRACGGRVRVLSYLRFAGKRFELLVGSGPDARGRNQAPCSPGPLRAASPHLRDSVASECHVTAVVPEKPCLQGTSTSLPMVFPDSMSWWARATSAKGYVVTGGASMLPSSSQRPMSAMAGPRMSMRSKR